ncbi:hypothetical protein [Chryseobacterium sp. H1D6B]|uniref:hypothetical protein n=1 Tax=Chryseobacterium sp. H1D6B TaxID=2940588 RepID=UPI0015CB5E3A|nr:hypothetical protein [Chryseobacterium sp. H1D6B]
MILFLLLCISAVNYQSQQKNLKQKNKLEGYKKNDEAYFIGTWKLTEKNYMDGNEKKIYPLQICMKQYTLKFVQENQNLFLIKNYA